MGTQANSFNSIRDFVFNITLHHPESKFQEIMLPRRFVEIDKRPKKDLRIQFSFGSESPEEFGILRGVKNGELIRDVKCALGRISLTGSFPLRPIRGWHTFDLLLDETIFNFDSQGELNTGSGEQILTPEETETLAGWLEDNRSYLWEK
jgi:hypothetical protein